MIDPDDLAESVRQVVGNLVRTTRADDVLPSAEAALLGRLHRDGPATIAELADWRRVRHQSAAKAVKELAERGLVTTAPHESDRRKVVVEVSAAGVAALDDDRRRRRDRLAAAIRGLAPGERADLARGVDLLARLTDQ